MGCGNNKVSRSYLTSQPVTTPSPKAAKASAANLGNQILRVMAQVSRESADRAAKARAEAARDAKAAAEAIAKDEADRKATDKKKAKEEATQHREHERLLNDLAYRASATAANNPTTYINHKGVEVPAWKDGITQHSNLDVQYMTDADGMLTTRQVHVSTIAKSDGSFDIHLSDHINGHGRVETIDLTGADAGDDLLIAGCQEFLTDMFRDLESNS
jgi:hypothetical protein